LNWPVIELGARYMAPARYGELVTVRTWLGDTQSRAFVIEYEVLNAQTRKVLCTGWTKHLNIDNEWQPRALPEDLKAFLMTEEAG
jgi:acyl-CoA thioester hydrolase